MKKFLSLILSVLMLLTSVNVFAQDIDLDAKFVVSEVSGKVGETVTVDISAVSNPGIVSLKLLVGYDSSALKLVSYNEKDFANVGWGPDTKNPFSVFWVDAINPNNTTSGVIAQLGFEILETANEGKSEITLSYNPNDVYNYDFENVEFETVSGGVIVLDETIEPTATLPTETTDPATEEPSSTEHSHNHIGSVTKGATCTEEGVKTYTCTCGDTYTTVIPVTEHNYIKNEDNQLACSDCGTVKEITGLYNDNGVWRYFVDGVAKSGWQLIDSAYYYFHEDIMGAKGGTYEVNDITYDFEETGKLVSGAWANTLNGKRYYYGPACYLNGWYEIDGNRYFFENTYRYEGYRMVAEENRKWYDFGTDGICKDEIIPDGFYNDAQKGLGYVVNGVGVEGLHNIDGDYYFFNEDGYAQTGKVSVGTATYYFGEDYKALTGLFDVDGVKFYCENGRPTMAGLVKIGEDYYFAGGVNGEITIDQRTYAWKTSCDLPMANYTFDKDGKMVNGIVEKDGKLCYYENGSPSMAGLIEINGDYYFASGVNGELTVGKKEYIWKDNGIQLENYDCEFGEDGKMLDGIIEKDGTLYYYEMGRPKMAGLIEIDGAYYFVGGANGEVTVDMKQYVWKDNGIVLENNDCEFGPDGKMLDGLVEKDGTLYYYVMGRPKMAGLIEIDGAYYFAGGANGEVTVDMKQYVWKDNGIQLENYDCEFGEDGKMLDGIVEKDGTLYYYVMGRPKMAGLIEIDGDYYFAGGANGEVTVSMKQYIWKDNGIALENLNCEFGPDGKMLDGVVEKDGGLYYYEMGSPKMAGLVEVDGDYYFAGGANGEITVNKQEYVWKSNGILPEDNYLFGEDGKMLDGFVTKDDGIYYYENGKYGTLGLNYIDGYYYFVDYAGKLWTNGKYHVWKTNGYSVQMSYTFDEFGRVIG